MNLIAVFRTLALAAASAVALAAIAPGTARADAPWTPAADSSADVAPIAPVAPWETVARPDSFARTEAPVAPAPGRGVEYLWVLRNTLVHAGDIPLLVERARAMRVRGLIVQVVGRGDGWYRSDLLPYPEPIREPGRDPLGELLPLAHAAGLEVHVWINCCLAWSAPNPPRDPRHVIRAHPEWVARLKDGRPMTRLSEASRRRLMLEGVFLSPAHPGVRRWIAGIAHEIASRYPVDGVHLDYIRQPSIGIGFDQTSRARFALEHGADPIRFDRLAWTERARMDSAWSAFQDAEVTAIVREVRDSLDAVRPGISLSAAVIADTLTAARRNHQAWPLWLREGLLDRVFVMCYAPATQAVVGQLAILPAVAAVDRIVPGIAIYNTSPATAAAKIRGARELGYPAVALYSYDSLFEREGLWEQLHAYLNTPRTLEDHP
jgi:uncharacterized lipoprotein YddW (UPF0748 family)